MYLLDLQTMLHLLHIHAHTGLLRAKIPTSTLEQRDTNTVTIAVVKGKLVSCTITNQENFPFLIGDQVLNALADMGPLNWTLTLQLTSSPLPSSPSITSGGSRNAIPRRLAEPQIAELSSWPRTQRLVFSLIDGKSSVTYIAYLLSLSSTLVERTIHELSSMNFVTFDYSRPLTHL